MEEVPLEDSAGIEPQEDHECSESAKDGDHGDRDLSSESQPYLRLLAVVGPDCL